MSSPPAPVTLKQDVRLPLLVVEIQFVRYVLVVKDTHHLSQCRQLIL